MERGSDRFSLEGKTVFVSGATSGIAQAVAEGLAEAGANLALAARREALLDTLAEKIRLQGRQALPVFLDITQMPSIRSAVHAALKEYGSIDVLINCAATNIRRPFLEMEEGDYDTVMNVNVKGQYFLSQEVCRSMAERKKGKVIHIASFVSFISLSRVSAYVAGKGAIAQLTKAMAVDLARYNIQVNAIAPGFIKTPFNELIWGDEAKYKWVVDRTLAGRFGMPADLIGAAQYLSSEASDFMTGQLMIVDGGLLAGTDSLFG